MKMEWANCGSQRKFNAEPSEMFHFAVRQGKWEEAVKTGEDYSKTWFEEKKRDLEVCVHMVEQEENVVKTFGA